MKPKDLKFPYPFEERRPYLGEGIFFIPRYYQCHAAFEFPTFTELFQNNRPVHVEYCSGNGLWVCEKAKNNPDQNWIAVEKDFERVRKIYAKKINQNLSNLFVVSGYAEPFAQYYLPSESVQTTYINFPDPWPKERHAKHRIVQESFIKDVMKTLTFSGELHLVTDDLPYSEQMKDVVSRVDGYVPISLEENLPEDHTYGISWFEKLWRSKGRKIIHLQYMREPLVCLSK